MKRFSLYLVGLCLSVSFLSSCLKGSNEWEGIAVGVLSINSRNMQPILTTSNAVLHAPSFVTLCNEGKMNYNDCYIILCKLNSDLPENSASAIEANGYQTVTLLDYSVIQKSSLNDYLVDTANILPSEMPLTVGLESMDYAANHLFLSHRVTIPDDWELTWSMSYDYNTMLPTIEGGQRYYDLFIRATANKQTENTQKIDKSFVNAYDMRDYFRRAATNEKSHLGTGYSPSSSKFTVRFNFATIINNELNTLTWGSDKIELDIVNFLPTVAD